MHLVIYCLLTPLVLGIACMDDNEPGNVQLHCDGKCSFTCSTQGLVNGHDCLRHSKKDDGCDSTDGGKTWTCICSHDYCNSKMNARCRNAPTSTTKDDGGNTPLVIVLISVGGGILVLLVVLGVVCLVCCSRKKRKDDSHRHQLPAKKGSAFEKARRLFRLSPGKNKSVSCTVPVPETSTLPSAARSPRTPTPAHKRVTFDHSQDTKSKEKESTAETDNEEEPMPSFLPSSKNESLSSFVTTEPKMPPRGKSKESTESTVKTAGTQDEPSDVVITEQFAEPTSWGQTEFTDTRQQKTSVVDYTHRSYEESKTVKPIN